MNDGDFDANINHDMCMKVMFLRIDAKLRIVIYIIYVHDDVDVSAYEYVYRYLYMHELKNED